MTVTTTLAALNDADRESFVRVLGAIYEHSPWIAARAWERRPFADRAALEEVLKRTVLDGTHEQQLDLIRRHPRLGTRGAMAERSRAEQRGAGLTTLADDERAELVELNERYERRFEIPFIVAVKGLVLRDIIANCRARLDRDATTEHEEALRQIFRIAGFRLADSVTE